MLSKEQLENLVKEKDQDVFKQMIKSTSELLSVTTAFPQYEAQLLNVVVNNQQVFKHLVKGDLYLMEIILCFPAYEAQLLNAVVNNQDTFEHVIENSQDLLSVTTAFPQYQAQLLNVVVNSQEVFNHVVKDAWHLQHIIRNFRGYKAQLLNVVVDNQEIFKRIFSDGPNVVIVAKALPDDDARTVKFLYDMNTLPLEECIKSVIKKNNSKMIDFFNNFLMKKDCNEQDKVILKKVHGLIINECKGATADPVLKEALSRLSNTISTLIVPSLKELSINFFKNTGHSTKGITEDLQTEINEALPSLKTPMFK
jgi:hypothetical protein